MGNAAGAESEARHLPLPALRKHLPALFEHVLIWPEGDKSRRRHAHTECVLRARKAGRLPTEEEWQATRPRATSPLARFRVRPFSQD